MASYLEHDADLIRRCLPGDAVVPEDSNALFLLYAVLLRAKGAETDLSDVHDAWSAWMLSREPNHEAIRPFGELDRTTQAEDEPFLSAIRQAAQCTDLSAP
jgi:hypothetical protein